MGLFNWFMRGLGVETDDQPNEKKKNKNATEETKYANFNLHEKNDGQTAKAEPVVSMNFNGFGVATETNVIINRPKNKKDIQNIVDYLRQGQTVTMDLGAIADEDRERILDFVSGAIYALSGSIVNLQGDLFMITPEGHRILEQKGEN